MADDFLRAGEGAGAPSFSCSIACADETGATSDSTVPVVVDEMSGNQLRSGETTCTVCEADGRDGAVEDDASGEKKPPRPEFFDACFRQKRKKGKYRLVEPPLLESPVVDTHAHVVTLRNPALELARCALSGVDFVVCMEDVKEPWERTYEGMDAWRAEAARLLPGVRENTLAALEEADAAWAVHYRDEFAHRTAEMVESPDACMQALPHLRIAIGCHPHNASYYNDALERTLVSCLKDPRVCGLGEVGLDYHYDFSPRDVQREVFRRQIRLAHETGLPLILHLREAHDDALQIMREEGFPAGGTLLHCFNLDRETLAPWLEEDCYVAIGGPVTFKTFDDLRAAVREVPADRLLTETDSPYMTPEPMRGSLCGPAHTIFTAARLAEERGFAPGDARTAFLKRLHDNARALLDREPTTWQCGA